MSACYLGKQRRKIWITIRKSKSWNFKNINILQTNLKHKNYDKNVLELINNVLKDLNQIDNIRIQVFELKITAKDAINLLDQQTQRNAVVASETQNIATQTLAQALNLVKDANSMKFKES